MARSSKIRWRESDTKELQRLINNYNNKLYRLNKNHPELREFLPQRITKKDAIASIETRADFNRLTASLKRFSKRGAEAPVSSSRGAKATKWEVDEFKRKQAAENARRTRERKKLESQEVTVAGKKQGKTRAEMGSVKTNELKPSKKKFERMSSAEWDKAKALMDKRMRSSYQSDQRRLMQVNYMRGMMHEGYSEDLINYISTIPNDVFFRITQTDETATIDFIYDPIALKAKEDVLWDLWEPHGSGKNLLGVNQSDIEYAELKNNATNEYFLNLLKGAV